MIIRCNIKQGNERRKEEMVVLDTRARTSVLKCFPHDYENIERINHMYEKNKLYKETLFDDRPLFYIFFIKHCI